MFSMMIYKPRRALFLTLFHFLVLSFLRCSSFKPTSNTFLQNKSLCDVRRSLLINAGKDTFSLSIIVEGRKKEIIAKSDETILAALERSGFQMQAPHDCRRGNCLTCSGKLLSGPKDSLKEERNTFLPSEASQKGIILTCCSSVVGPGLCIELCQNTEAWKIAYQDRYINEDTRRIGQEASAKVMRTFAEQHPEKWIETVEENFQCSPLDENSN